MKKKPFVRRIIVNGSQEGLRFETPDYDEMGTPKNSSLFIGNQHWGGAFFTRHQALKMVSAIKDILKAMK